MSTGLPEDCKLYLSQLDRDDPFNVVVKWFPPPQLALSSTPELRAYASGEKDVQDCLTRLGVTAYMAWVGELADGTPLSEVRSCTAADLVKLLTERVRTAGLLRGWYTLLAYGVGPEEMLRRMKEWISSRPA